MKKVALIGAVAAVVLGLLIWLYYISTRPLPGEKFAYNCDNAIDFSKADFKNEPDKCRIHVPEGTDVKYPTNPPTFGPHYPSWITKGFYDEPRPDGNLVHSQEHGYIIFWYDCEAKSFSLIPGVFAQNMTAGSEGSPSAKLENMPKSFSDGSCNDLKNSIKGMISQLGDHKIIAVPRVGLGKKLVLTAWDRKFIPSSLDKNQIKNFVDSFRDAGPEATNEP